MPREKCARRQHAQLLAGRGGRKDPARVSLPPPTSIRVPSDPPSTHTRSFTQCSYCLLPLATPCIRVAGSRSRNPPPSPSPPKPM
ncbi:hypothetical protein T492DRAFT_957875 [Pavlovales sp. CCMP2436]|nr:hypothetical protein T492DRAFT_957875 [Pavlovales sp. CCMP2436]